jgi:protein SCO1/2
MLPFRPLLLILIVAALSVTAGSLLWNSMQSGPDYSQRMVFAAYPEPRVIADFDLRGPQGSAWSLQQLKDRWTLVFFGFTYCPDVCPSTLLQLAELRKALADDLDEEMLPAVLFVSVDPDRDSPEKIADYVQFFDPSFVGITGADAQIAALTLQMGIAYHVEQHDEGADDYDVGHSAGILLLNPEARLVGVFTAPHDVGDMKRELLRLIGTGRG